MAGAIPTPMSRPTIQWPAGPDCPLTIPGTVDVWGTDLDACAVDLPLLEAILSAEERARAARFVRDQDRRRWTAATAQLRIVLSRYLRTAPSDLRFRRGLEGKPSLDGLGALRFNMSHSGGIALYAVTSDAEVGIDVESVRALPDLHGVAQRFFSPGELDDLRGLPPELAPVAFYYGWTRKEAVLKATGQGIGGSTASFDVTLAPGVPPKVLRGPRLRVHPSQWSLFHLEPARGAVGALAVQSPGMRIRQWRIPE